MRNKGRGCWLQVRAESPGRRAFRRWKETGLDAGLGDLWRWRDPARGPWAAPGRDSAARGWTKWASAPGSRKPARPSGRFRSPRGPTPAGPGTRARRSGRRVGLQRIAPAPAVSSASGAPRRRGSPGSRGEPPWGGRGLTPRAVAGRSWLLWRSGAAARSGAGAEGKGGGSPDPAGGERADRIWSLREAWSEVAPCAVGPRGGARLCGGLGPHAPPQYPRVCPCVPALVQGLASEALACGCTRVSVHIIQ